MTFCKNVLAILTGQTNATLACLTTELNVRFLNRAVESR